MTYDSRNSDAVYALNSYVWKLVQANLEWSASDYSGGNPIVPAAQVPELMTTGKAFIVYGSSLPPIRHLYALKTESIAFNIYSPSATEANNVSNLLIQAFEGQDESAQRVNRWLDTEPLPVVEGGDDWAERRPVTFGSIRPTFIEKAEPADEEGGYVASLVLLEVVYTQEDPAAVLDFGPV